MSRATPPNPFPSDETARLVDPPSFEQRQAEPTSYWGVDFWGQFVPLAFVVTLLAAIVSMSTAPPLSEQPASQSRTPIGLSHEDLDSRAAQNIDDILPGVPENPHE